MAEPCQLCEKRKPKRYCPAVRGGICVQCCAEEREEKLDCPLDCEFVLEWRQQHRAPEPSADQIPNRDIKVTEEFLYELEPVLSVLASATLEAALATPGAVDTDVREAYEAMIKTYRTLNSGLIYESRPNNPYAGAIQQRIKASIDQFQERIRQANGMETLRDNEILGLLVFLQRMELVHNNGRRRSKAFLSFLLDRFIQQQQQQQQAEQQDPQGPSLIQGA